MNVGYYFWLKWKQIELKEYYFSELLDIKNDTAFFFTLGTIFSKNKNREAKKCEIGCKLQVVLWMHLVKDFIYIMPKIIIQKVNFWFYYKNLRLPAKFQQNLYPVFRWYLDKVIKFADKKIFYH